MPPLPEHLSNCCGAKVQHHTIPAHRTRDDGYPEYTCTECYKPCRPAPSKAPIESYGSKCPYRNPDCPKDYPGATTAWLGGGMYAGKNPEQPTPPPPKNSPTEKQYDEGEESYKEHQWT